MSGPITVTFGLDLGVLLLAQHAISEARAMKREYGEVLAQLRRREAELALTREGQEAARTERIAATRREAARLASRVERLRMVAGDLPEAAARVPQALPAAPRGDDDIAWDDYLRALDAATGELEALLLQSGGAGVRRMLEALSPTTPAPSVHDALTAYVRERQRQPGLDPDQAEQFRETAARVLARLELAPGETLPEELEALARAIVLAPSVERAEALASELRLAVQQSRDARQRDAAACVLEQSLRDLGYEVEDIEATLFADGGTVHFTRQGWENYFVRMRLDPREGTANFNVVRASRDEDTAERRRLDALAEDRWCAEFPRLMETLAARGIRMTVTRSLGAGEVPVQVVDGSSLPRMQAPENARPRAAPLARRTP